MSTLTQTHIYTSAGRQRPVILPSSGTARFVLQLLPGDSGVMQTTCDPPEQLKRGTAIWEDYQGGIEGAVGDVTAVRAVLGHNSGWAKLVVQHQGDKGLVPMNQAGAQ